MILVLGHKITNTYYWLCYHLLEMLQTPPLIPISKNKYMSASEINSSSTLAILSIATQAYDDVRSKNDLDIIYNFLSYGF